MTAQASSLPTILIIVGITGDLSRRKLLPALCAIARAGMLPTEFKIIGVSRREVSVDQVLDNSTRILEPMLHMRQMDFGDQADYARLSEELDAVQAHMGKSAQRIFYLSVPAQIARPIIRSIGTSGLGSHKNTKLLIEKPFGYDLQSARELIDEINQSFTEEQVYRIDHFLAKEMAQNLIIFRSSNSLFQQTWDARFIESIDIVASEQEGVAGRADFYEQTGAMRDLIQSHLLQLAALVLMELPADEAWSGVPAMRLRALSDLVLADGTQHVLRAQYEGYQADVSNPGSRTETYAALTVESKDPRWQGVPIRIASGKGLARKATEIHVHYRQGSARQANTLTLFIQPNEGVRYCMWAKKPGYTNEAELYSLDFSYDQKSNMLSDAYERVFLDAIKGDHTLFMTNQEVLEAWRVVQPLLDSWEMDSRPLRQYDLGTPIENLQQILVQE